ncbi:conjugal transfer protein TrbM [Klebsiella pneumoniae]|nr:conjugal transfer protein TrbM [Klebsiella pneumoniae]ELE4368167.1 conjugal transfer protein TrbM [Salmonella enterica]EMD7130176.1 conjugal transfer protein TrbM [Salmonella enterica]BBW89498.1 hypothetical protein THOKLE017_P30350 [Klebsiella pneumoniae]
MKKLLIGMICVVAPLQFAQAEDYYNDVSDLGPIEEQAIQNSDPCTVVMCMWGKVAGEPQSECSGAEKKFFSLVKKKHGHFNASRTFNYRKQFLGNCPTADPAHVSKILDKFGRMRWF